LRSLAESDVVLPVFLFKIIESYMSIHMSTPSLVVLNAKANPEKPVWVPTTRHAAVFGALDLHMTNKALVTCATTSSTHTRVRTRLFPSPGTSQPQHPSGVFSFHAIKHAILDATLSRRHGLSVSLFFMTIRHPRLLGLRLTPSRGCTLGKPQLGLQDVR
jgi:hypothetical protein